MNEFIEFPAPGHRGVTVVGRSGKSLIVSDSPGPYESTFTGQPHTRRSNRPERSADRLCVKGMNVALRGDRPPGHMITRL